MSKLKKYLITTRIKETWPQNKKNHLIFSSIVPLNKFPNKKFPYKKFSINKKYWSDNNRASKDFKYLDDFYENVLEKFFIYSNSLHKTQYKKKFWRILVGPWLGQFMFIMFDRWQILNTTLKKYKINKVKNLIFDKDIFIPYESEDFIKLTQNDLWNQFIYQNIYPYLLPKKKLENINLSKSKISKYLTSFRQRPDELHFIKRLIFKFFNIFKTKNFKYLIFQSYLGAVNELKLALKLRQTPIFDLNKKKYNLYKKVNKNLRNTVTKIIKPKNEFENFFLNSLKYHLPKVYLENFSDLENFSQKSNLPKNPKKIMTSGGLWYDSFFSYHVAKLSENGSKIIYGQHGGAYGIVKYSWPEKHEKKISDKYLTWGWKGTKLEKNIKPFYVVKKKNNYSWKKSNQDLLFLLKHRKVYLQSPETQACFDIYSEYMKFCHNFFVPLDKKIKKKVILRLKYQNLKPETVDYFSFLEKDFTFDSSKSFLKACKQAKLIIHTSNSTTFPETLSANIPSILILNRKNNPVRKEAKKIIKLLEKNNLIFFDSYKAGKFVNFIWEKNIKKWWQKKNTQIAVKEFQRNFAKPSKNIVNATFDELKVN